MYGGGRGRGDRDWSRCRNDGSRRNRSRSRGGRYHDRGSRCGDHRDRRCRRGRYSNRGCWRGGHRDRRCRRGRYSDRWSRRGRYRDHWCRRGRYSDRGNLCGGHRDRRCLRGWSAGHESARPGRRSETVGEGPGPARSAENRGEVAELACQIGITSLEPGIGRVRGVVILELVLASGDAQEGEVVRGVQIVGPLVVRKRKLEVLADIGHVAEVRPGLLVACLGRVGELAPGFLEQPVVRVQDAELVLLYIGLGPRELGIECLDLGIYLPSDEAVELLVEVHRDLVDVRKREARIYIRKGRRRVHLPAIGEAIECGEVLAAVVGPFLGRHPPGLDEAVVHHGYLDGDPSLAVAQDEEAGVVEVLARVRLVQARIEGREDVSRDRDEGRHDPNRLHEGSEEDRQVRAVAAAVG